ncbi:MAG: permease [Bacteroidota bacterium]
MEKTLSLLLIIGLGLIIQSKVKSLDQLKGIKVLILSIALPATIFAALLNVKVDPDMLLLPLLGLLVNVVLLVVFYIAFKGFVPIIDDKKRTLLMLMPSLAPGLSCFPFIAEYLGSDALAMAALADLGNKVFVLILLYLLAMRWYYRSSTTMSDQKENRLKKLFISLVKEPINLVILAALALLAFGFNMQGLPSTVSSLVMRLSAMMGPLVLLFIGMAVKIKKNDLGLILRMLSLRSGLAFLLCSVLMAVIPNLSSMMMMLLLVFAQSSTSFWPYAHISVVNELEVEAKNKTFNSELALSVLALSLPFSTFVILGVLSFPSIAVSPVYPATIGVLLVLVFLISPILYRLKRLKPMEDQELEVSEAP